jgi:multidrug efflux pump subunit AcrA (membrane-fusion protein)
LTPDYVDPDEDTTTEAHVLSALDFLVSIEPNPQPQTLAEYKAALAPYEAEIARALAVLRNFAEQMQPATLEEMQVQYYTFTNDKRYLTSPAVTSTAIAYLNEAWNGVGPWRR